MFEDKFGRGEMIDSRLRRSVLRTAPRASVVALRAPRCELPAPASRKPKLSGNVMGNCNIVVLGHQDDIQSIHEVAIIVNDDDVSFVFVSIACE